jgi:deoxyribonucleoside regulator
MNEAIYMYYVEKKTVNEIAGELNVSKSTVSRLLKRASDEKIVEFKIMPDFMECIELGRLIKHKYSLESVMVTPIPMYDEKKDSLEIKKRVALEGARYVQRIISDDDIIGLSWGGTMYFLIQYLNPCRKVNACVVTLHGSIANCDKKFDVKTLVRRAAMAFGGTKISLEEKGLFDTLEEMEKFKSSEEYKRIYSLFGHINISVSGVGAIHPSQMTPLVSTDYLTDEERKKITDKGANCDIMLRFIDKKGRECNTAIKDRTFSIDLKTYKKIPRKVIVASGKEKVHAIHALINGGLLDVLIIDQLLAHELAAAAASAFPRPAQQR